MKVNEPITKAQKQEADERHRKAVAANKKALMKAAEMIETRQPLTDLQAGLAAAAIRFCVEQMSSERPNPQGAQPTISEEVLIHYCLAIKKLVEENGSLRRGDKNSIYEALGEQFGSPDGETVRKRIKDLM